LKSLDALIKASLGIGARYLTAEEQPDFQ